jgi:prephenate dehydrogenase
VRSGPTGWADELLLDGRHYVGFTPLLSPLYLHDVTGGVGSAHADLFDHGLIAISATPETVSAAMKIASDLAELLKATPLFSDIMEVDGYMAALHVMPQLIAGALSQTTTSQPGWHEGRKFAGRAYAQASSSITNLDEPVGLAAAAVLNKQNTVRVLDGMMASLQALRDEIENGDHETLEKHLQKAREGRQQWWADRGAANWAGENIPEMDIAAARPKLFGRLIPERKRPEEE